jgi:hypothetical protein
MEAAYGSFSENTVLRPGEDLSLRAQTALGVMALENDRSGRICASSRDHGHHAGAGTAAITAADELGSHK